MYHCLACSTYLHEDCMSSREWETVRLHDHLEEHQQEASPPPEDLEPERSDAIQQYYEELTHGPCDGLWANTGLLCLE